jgi:hypothetical protein
VFFSCDRHIARSRKIAALQSATVFQTEGARSMNVTNPSTQHTTQALSHTLPIKRGTETPTVETGTPNAKTTPVNPAHLGNHIDTSA